MEEPKITNQVFIGGSSRSGTTLLGAMLGEHGSVITTPESHFKYRVYCELGGKIDKTNLYLALNAINKHWRFRIWDLDIDTHDLLDRVREPSYAGLLNYIVEQYAMQVGRERARIWVDHTPENVTYGNTLLHLFPQAKFVHIVRDGRGVASSIMPLDWGPNTVTHAAHWWIESVSHGLALEILLREDQIMRVQYEELVGEPTAILKAICDFIGIDFIDSMTDAKGFKVPDYTASQHEMIGQKPDIDRVTSWRKTLTPRQIEKFEYESRDFLTYLGYSLSCDGRNRGSAIHEIVVETLNETWRKAVTNNLRWLRRSAPLWLSHKRKTDQRP